MKLSMEIPKKHLVEFSKLTEVDFALAHLVLEDKEYAEFYKAQAAEGRRVLLDNSMHELNKQPMNIGEVLEAAKRIKPTVVIAPDKLGDAQFTHDQFNLMRKDPRALCDVGLVVQGSSTADRVSLVSQNMRYTKTLLLPYREPRSMWLQELVAAMPAYTKWPPHLHLLGVNDLSELPWFVRVGKQLRWPQITLDTSKPIKWALQNKRTDELPSLRGGGLLDHGAELTIEQRLLAFYNIAHLRTFMG